MNYFGTELHFGLIKNVNEDSSFIDLVIPEVILKFLSRYESDLNISINKFIELESGEVRHFYNEEVEEIKSLSYTLLKSLESESICQISQNYRDIFHLNEIDFSQEDVKEIFQHLIHLCDTVLNGKKILYVSASYDDSAFIKS